MLLELARWLHEMGWMPPLFGYITFRGILGALTALLLSLLLPWSAAQAQGLDIGLVSGNEGSLPITVVPMPYQGSAGAPDTDVAEVIRNDLNRSGQFKSLAVERITERPTRGGEIQFPTWRDSPSANPRVVIAGVPMRSPLVTNGGRGSLGTAVFSSYALSTSC